jgi:hypothetical protein
MTTWEEIRCSFAYLVVFLFVIAKIVLCSVGVEVETPPCVSHEEHNHE